MLSANKVYQQAAESMKNGGVIAYPTEGVWGLGCDPLNQAAVKKVLQIKSRPVEKGLILLSSDIEHFSPYTNEVSEQDLQQIRGSMGQGITWLINSHGKAPDWISGGQSTLAIRLTNHPVVAGLCSAFGGAIVSTSANPAGLDAAVQQEQVESYFGNLIDVIVPGQTCGQNGASEIRDLQTGRVVRPKAG